MASVSVATAVPAAPPDALAMERPGIVGVVASWKLDAETPLAYVTPISVTVSVAPCRFASASGEGLEARDAPAVAVTENVSAARSVGAVLASRSVAVMVTVTAPEVAASGVPQTSRASAPGQPGASVPVASKTRPLGRLAAA